MAKHQMCPELAGERTHRLILPIRGYTYSPVTPPARFRDQALEQDATDPSPADAGFDAESHLGQGVVRLLRRMQLGRAAHRAVFHIGNDDRAVVRALLGVARDEAVIQKAVEAF